MKTPKIYLFGEKGCGLKCNGDIQDFNKIRQECLASGKLFEDKNFPPNSKSLGLEMDIKWMRPKDIVQNPEFIVDGVSRFDLIQGYLGNCWLVAAMANLTLHDKLFTMVIPEDQSFEDGKYASIFHFRFWQYGKWLDIVVDDLLPVRGSRLIFIHSADKNEFWSALLEKAYAKLHGSYEALEAGNTKDAMEDFTGGITEEINLQEEKDLYTLMEKAHIRYSLMGCFIALSEGEDSETKMDNGLVKGHAYSITDVKTTSTGAQLIRVRNPWGNETEWTGTWSDKSEEWNSLSADEKESLNFQTKEDGEFWMSVQDFKSNFTDLEICNLTPDSLSEQMLQDNEKKHWETSIFYGSWVAGITAGGCPNFKDSWCKNPQYRITLTDPDDENDNDLCTILVALMQYHNKAFRKDTVPIGFAIYEIEDPKSKVKMLEKNELQKCRAVANCGAFRYDRAVKSRHKLPAGTYCIIPSTFQPGQETDFLLRVFAEHKTDIVENDEDIKLEEVPRLSHKNKADLHELHDIKNIFFEVAGEDKEVDWKELKDFFDKVGGEENRKYVFSEEICRSMVSMVDADGSGKLNCGEFLNLFNRVKMWINVFRLYDIDNSDCLDVSELRTALRAVGYFVNNHILNNIVQRYATKNGQLSIRDFITCAIKLKTMIDVFMEHSTDNKLTASFSLGEWLSHTL